ncbi:TD and POZ domain-containing protein 1 [Trichonephila clavipes]|nr:TD and POZ domain-containing protein 1 [Trichonephila clavipes]
MEMEGTDIMERGTILLRETLRIRCRVWRTDGQEATPSTFIARTILNVKRIDFRWDIERFSSIKSGQKVSYVLKPLSRFGKKTLIHIKEKKDKIMMSIEFRYTAVDHLKLQSFIVDKNGSQKNCGEREVWPVSCGGAKEYVISTLPFTKKYLMDNKDLYLKNDSLSLHFKCSWRIGWISNQFERIDSGRIIPEPHVSNADMKRLIEMHCSKEGSEHDVKLCEYSNISGSQACTAHLRLGVSSDLQERGGTRVRRCFQFR